MKPLARIFWSALAAVLVPTLITVAYFGFSMAIAGDNNGGIFILMLLAALIVSFAHVLILGLPAAFCLNELGRLNAWSIAVAGFIAGSIPFGILTWPIDGSKYPGGYSYWDGAKMVDAKINGIPTLIGWIDYLKGVFLPGALGLAAGVAFWLIWSNRLTYCPTLRLRAD
jgi:hypothetical protein